MFAGNILSSVKQEVSSVSSAMGQRAVLLLSELLLLLLLLTASRTLLAVSFPEDSVPLNVVDAHCEYTHANEFNK